MMEFWTNYLWPLIVMLAQSLLMLVVLLIAIAYLLLADRKIWAAVQIRRGPNVVGPWGLLQSFADLFKFVLKEPTIPAGANKGVFVLAPLVTCVLSLAAWAVIPVNAGWLIADTMWACSTSSRSPRSASTASSWGGGRRTRNIRSCRPCVRPRRWCPTRSRSAS